MAPAVEWITAAMADVAAEMAAAEPQMALFMKADNELESMEAATTRMAQPQAPAAEWTQAAMAAVAEEMAPPAKRERGDKGKKKTGDERKRARQEAQGAGRG